MNIQKLSQLSIIFIAFCLIVVILYSFASFLRPFIFAIIITILVVPYTLKKSEKKSHWTIKTTKQVLTVTLILIVVLLLNLFLHDNVTELEQDDVQKGFKDQILDFNINLFGKQIEVSQFLDDDKINSIIDGSFKSIFGSVGSFFSEIVTIVLFLIFLIPSYKVFINNINLKISKKHKKQFLESIHIIEKNLRDYLLIKTQVSFLTGFITTMILLLFGVKFAILFGFLTFILNFIPNIGSFIAVGLVLIYELLLGTSSITLWIVLALLLSITQFIIGSILEPKLAGEKFNISPIIILLSLFFWGYIWGIWGMFFSVPLTLFVKVMLEGLGFFNFLKEA